MKRFALALSLSCLAPGVSHALDQYDDEALQETQKLLKSPGERQKFINGNADAQKADAEARKLGGSAENVEGMYAITGDVLQAWVQEDSDPAALQLKLQQALQDPEKFFNQLSPAQKAKIKKMSKDIDGRKTASP